jgi:excisionase family DNA binding protein
MRNELAKILVKLSEDQTLLNATQAAKLVGVSSPTIATWAKQGALKFKQKGRFRLFDAADVRACAAKKYSEPEGYVNKFKAAEFLGVSDSSLNYYAIHGYLEYVIVNETRHFKMESLANFKSNQGYKPKSSTTTKTAETSVAIKKNKLSRGWHVKCVWRFEHSDAVDPKRFKNIPHTPDGDKEFLEAVLNVATLKREMLALMKEEAPKRPTIYQELERIILREESKFF